MGRLLTRRSLGLFSTSVTTSPLRSRPLGCRQRQANERIDSRRSRTDQLADSPAWQRKCAAPLPAGQPSASSLFSSARRAQRLTRPNPSHGERRAGERSPFQPRWPRLLWAVRVSGCCWSHDAGGGFRPGQEQVRGQVRFERCQVNPPCAGAHHLAPAENEGAGFGNPRLATVGENRPDGQERDLPGVHPPPGVPREGVRQRRDVDRETALSARWTAARPYRFKTPLPHRSRSGAPTAHLLPSPRERGLVGAGGTPPEPWQRRCDRIDEAGGGRVDRCRSGRRDWLGRA
ncbi:MAG: hypothetical protein KatS3mg061_2292 [Dehalococcoidia bacterium]|nr:MAG: hypothetical protein KatS3mg061_2292 [Dehalococcoidia bacterium]